MVDKMIVQSSQSRSKFRILPYLLILPTLIFVSIFTILPTIKAVYGSLFKENQAVIIPRFIGLDNYVSLFTDPIYHKIFLNTVLFTITTVPLSIILALFFAMLLNQKIKALGLYRLMIFHPTMLPMVSAATIFLFVFAPEYGLINDTLRYFNIIGPRWLGNPDWALIAIGIISIWKLAGFYMIFYLAGLQNMSSEYLEAAQIDGANSWEQFRYITFPLLAGTTLFISILGVVNAFQSVDQVYILTHGGPNNASNMLMFNLYETQFRFQDTGLSYTMTVILILLLLIFTFLDFHFTEKRATYEY